MNIVTVSSLGTKKISIRKQITFGFLSSEEVSKKFPVMSFLNLMFVKVLDILSHDPMLHTF